MATVDLTIAGASGLAMSSSYNRLPQLIEVFVSAADVVAAKGSAIADADVIQCVDIPAECMVLGGAVEVITADTGSDVLMNVGYGGNTDAFVQDGDITSTGYLAAGAGGAAGVGNAFRVTAADTLDIVMDKTITFTSNDDWKVRIAFLMVDLAGAGEPAPAQALNS